MSHPFFDAFKFPWDYPLAKKFHRTLFQTIDRANAIELRCKKCSNEILLNKSAAADDIWQEALEKLTTARVLQKLCEDLLADHSVAAIHSTVLEVVNAVSVGDPLETDVSVTSLSSVVVPSLPKNVRPPTNISTAVEPVVVDEVKPTRPDFDPAVGKEQLIPIANRLLAECPEAQASIIEFNKITDSPSPPQLARRIIESTEPMRFLINCVDREYTIEPPRAIHHKRCFLALAEVLAPICLTAKNLSSIYATIHDSEMHFAEIDTKEPLVAKAVVGLIHGVPVDGNELNTWKKLSSTDLRSGRDFAAALPEPPELGVAGLDIVDVFVKGLAVFLNRPQNVGAVKAALRVQKEKGVHLCVLFSDSPNPAALKKLKQELTDVILLVGCVNVESDENYYVVEQFKQIRDFFSPKG